MITEKRLADIERRLERVPGRFRQAAPQVYVLTMGGGNAIFTYGSLAYYGVAGSTSATVSSVPTANPPITDGGCPTGLSWAYLANEDGIESLAWVGTNLQPIPTAAATVGMQSYIPKFTAVLALRKVSMQVGTSGVWVPVYVPDRLT